MEPEGEKFLPTTKPWEVFLLGGQIVGRLHTPFPGRAAGSRGEQPGRLMAKV